MLTYPSAIHAAQHHSEGKSLVIVRVPKRDELSLTTALDAGAAGIVLPHCESAQEIKDFIKEMYYGKIWISKSHVYVAYHRQQDLSVIAPSPHGLLLLGSPRRCILMTRTMLRRQTTTSASFHK